MNHFNVNYMVADAHRKKYPFKMGNDGSQDVELESREGDGSKNNLVVFIFLREVLHARFELNFLLVALQTLTVFQLFEVSLVLPEAQKLFVF